MIETTQGLTLVYIVINDKLTTFFQKVFKDDFTSRKHNM